MGCDMLLRSTLRKLPAVFSVEEVSDLLIATPGPGLRFCGAFPISHDALLSPMFT